MENEKKDYFIDLIQVFNNAVEKPSYPAPLYGSAKVSVLIGDIRRLQELCENEEEGAPATRIFTKTGDTFLVQENRATIKYKMSHPSS